VARSKAASAERFGWIFAEQRTIVVREASELDEALLHGDPGDRDRRRIALSQEGMNRAQPLVPQERHGAEAENIIKCAVQASPRDVEMRADLGNMDGTQPG
jgi:hypothetical protein